MKKKDGTTNSFEQGDRVVYIPKYLLMGDRDKMIKEKNLGVVSSINKKFVFVRYKSNNTAEATEPKDLYFINNREDLIEKLEQK